MIEVTIIDEVGNLWELTMKCIPRLGEKIIIANKLHTVTNVTWIIDDKNYYKHKCQIFILKNYYYEKSN